MNKIVVIIGLILFFILGFIGGKFYYEPEKKIINEDIVVISNEIKNLSKLVVSQGNFSEIYSFTDSKKYFNNYLSFDKKAVVSVNAKVEIGYNLKELEITLDSINKKIYISKIPKQDITIIPNIKYITLDDNMVNEFTTKEHNKIRKKAISRIEETIELTSLKKEAKSRLLEELSRIFQLSKVYHWEVVNKTADMDIQDEIMFLNDKYKG